MKLTNKHIINILNIPIMVCFIIFLITTLTMAEDITPKIIPTHAEVVLSEDKVYVDGVVENGLADRSLTLLILYPNTDVNNIRVEDIATMNQTETQENPVSGGQPIFAFEPYLVQETAPTGTYTIWIKGYGLEDVIKTFTYKGVDIIYESLDSITKATDISTAISNNYEKIGIDGVSYISLNSEAKALINPFILSKINGLDLSKYSDYTTNYASARAVKGIAVDFRNYYNDILAMGKFCDKNNAAGIKEWLQTYSDKVNLEENNKEIYRIYADMTDKQKDIVCLSLSSFNTLISYEGIRNAFYEQTLLKGIEILPWTAVKKIITDFSVKFESGESKLNWSDFSNLNSTNKDSVYEKMVGKPYATLDAAREAFNEAVTELLSKQSEQAKGGNTGGNYGGSGGNISIVPIKNFPLNESEEQNVTSIFEDIKSVPWAKEAINTLAQKGIISGRNTGKFEPEARVTRAEFIKILIGAFNLKQVTGENNFKDVNEGDWFYPYVLTAQKYGLATGKGDGTFGADEFITRQDMTVLLYRTVVISGVLFSGFDENVTFKDNVEISEYAKKAVIDLANKGVVKGMEDGTFSPLGNATRAQAAKVVYEIMVVMK